MSGLPHTLTGTTGTGATGAGAGTDAGGATGVGCTVSVVGDVAVVVVDDVAAATATDDDGLVSTPLSPALPLEPSSFPFIVVIVAVAVTV